MFSVSVIGHDRGRLASARNRAAIRRGHHGDLPITPCHRQPDEVAVVILLAFKQQREHTALSIVISGKLKSKLLEVLIEVWQIHARLHKCLAVLIIIGHSLKGEGVISHAIILKTVRSRGISVGGHAVLLGVADARHVYDDAAIPPANHHQARIGINGNIHCTGRRRIFVVGRYILRAVGGDNRDHLARTIGNDGVHVGQRVVESVVGIVNAGQVVVDIVDVDIPVQFFPEIARQGGVVLIHILYRARKHQRIELGNDAARKRHALGIAKFDKRILLGHGAVNDHLAFQLTLDKAAGDVVYLGYVQALRRGDRR